MAEHPNVVNIRRGLLLRKEREPTQEDFEFLFNLFHEDVVWHGGGSSEMWSEDFRGRDAVFQAFGELESAGSFERELKQVFADDRHAVALVRNDVHLEDVHMQWNEVMVFHLNAEGRITEFWGIHEDAEAVDALWTRAAA